LQPVVTSIPLHLPPERIGDVILIDPADEEYPVGFNVLPPLGAGENLLASDLVAVFRRLATSWGDQMTSVLATRSGVLGSTKGGTLVRPAALPGRTGVRKHSSLVTDPESCTTGQKEFPLLTGPAAGTVLTRLDTFLRHYSGYSIKSRRTSYEPRSSVTFAFDTAIAGASLRSASACARRGKAERGSVEVERHPLGLAIPRAHHHHQLAVAAKQQRLHIGGRARLHRVRSSQ